MLTRHLACGLGALVLLLAFGCAGQSPTAGDPPSGAATPPDGPRPLGHYTLLVNNGQASLTPAVHGQALGDSRPFDATQYFRSTPCHDCARIAAVGLTADGKVAVDVAIRHPFRNTETRKDLDVFDVRGILGVQPAVTFPSTPGILGKPLSTDPNALLNADGYTTHFSETLPEGSATLNPYRRFFTETDPSAEGVGEYLPDHRMAMASGWDTQRFLLKPTAGPQTFDFLIEVSYGQSARSPQNGTPAEDPGGWLDPLYFLPEFHQKEASIQAVNVVAAPAAETAGTLSLTARAADWQVGVDIDEYYPNPENLSGLKVASGIAGVMLEVPGLGVFSEDPVSASGTGSGLDPITWTFSQSVAAAAEGRYPALVTAIDERYDPEAVASSADDHRAFQVTTVRIQPGGVNGQLPEAVLFSLPAPASAILRDAQFTFDGTYSYDPDGHPITRLDMDFDYDGSTFDVDFTASTPSGASVSHRYTAVGSYTCALRVQSSQGEWSDVATLPVVVSEDPVIPSPTVNWTRGVNVSPDDHFVRTDEASDSAIAVASDGTVHIAYVQEEEAIFLGTNYYVWYRKVSPSGVASPAEEVYHELRLDSVLPYSAIARTPTGTICIAYSLGSEIHYTAKGGGGWTTPVVIAAADDWGGEDLGRFDLAAAGNTKALAYDVEVAGTDLRKVLVVFQQGGVWQAEENAGVAYRAWGFTNPSLTAHDNGYVMAWEGGGLAGATNNDVFIRRWSSGSWGPKETVANTTADEGHPSVAVTGNTVAVGYLRSPSVFGRISFNGQPLGPEKALFQAAGTITYVEPVLVGGADGALACLALEKASGGQILGQPVLLAFDQSMELPIRDGLITRNLQVPSPGDPEYHHPDLAGDGVNRVACLVEINEPGFQRLRVIQGNFQMP